MAGNKREEALDKISVFVTQELDAGTELPIIIQELVDAGMQKKMATRFVESHVMDKLDAFVTERIETVTDLSVITQEL